MASKVAKINNSQNNPINVLLENNTIIETQCSQDFTNTKWFQKAQFKGLVKQQAVWSKKPTASAIG